MTIDVIDFPLRNIELLLREVDQEFVCPLSTRVGCVDEYALKLFKYARHFVAMEDQNIAAWVAVYLNDKKSRHAFITIVVVIPQFRRRGIGKCILDSVFDYAKGEGFRDIFLEVSCSAYGALRLYKRLGFEEQDFHKESDVLLMRKNLLQS